MAQGRRNRSKSKNRKAKITYRIWFEPLEERWVPSNTDTWQGGGPDTNWMTPANWVGTVAPQSGDDLVFPASTNTATNNDFSGATFNSITFQAGGYTVTGNDLTLGGTSTTALSATNTSGANVFNPNITLASAEAFSTAAGGTLTVGGNIANGGFLLTVSGDGSSTLSGTINGTGGLAMNGTGTLTLSNTNNGYSGNTTVTAGTVALVSNAGTSSGLQGLGGNSWLGTQAVTINGGAININPGGANDTITSLQRPITWGTSGGTLTLSKRVTDTPPANAWTINAADATPAVVQYGIIVPGTGIGGWNTGPGSGSLQIGNNAVTTLLGTGTVRFELTGGAAVGYQQPSFGGKIVFSGVPGGVASGNTTSNTATNVGRVAFDAANPQTVTVTGGIFLQNAVQVTARSAAKTIDSDITILSGATDFSGRTNGAATDGLTLSATTGGHTLTIQSGATAVMDLRLRNDGTGVQGPIVLNSNVDIKAGGTLLFTNSLPSQVTVTGANPQIVVNGNITGEGTVGSPALVDLQIDTGSNSGTALLATWSTGAKLIVNGSGSEGLTFLGDTGAGSTGNQTAATRINNVLNTAIGGQTLLQGLTGTGGTLTESISDNSTGVVINSAPSAASSIKLAASSVGGTITAGAAANDLTNFAGLIVKGGTVKVAQNETFAGASPSTLDVTAGTLDLSDASNNGRILTVSGNVTLASGTTISGGTGTTQGSIVFGGNLVNGNATVNNTPNLTANGTGAQSINPISGLGTFTINNTGGTVSLTGVVAAQNMILTAGTLSGGIINASNSFTLQSGSVNPQLGGTGSVTKNTAGTVTLAAPNIYTGNTTVAAGTLLVNNVSQSGTGNGTVTVNGGTLGGTGTIAGPVIVNSGGTVNPGVTTGILAAASGNFSGGGNLQIDVQGTATPGTNYDRLNLGSGALSLGGTSTLTLNLAGLSTAGKVVGVVVYGSATGLFNTVTTTNNPNNLVPTLTYGPTSLDIQFSAASTTVLTAAPGTTVFGQTVTFTATVSGSGGALGTPTGTVTFEDGTTNLATATLAAGVANFATSGLTVGNHTITAIYGGDTNFGPSTSSTLVQTVNKAGTTTSVTASAGTTVFGQAVTFTTTVSAASPGAGNPTGTVTILDGAASLATAALTVGTGKASFTTSALGVGSHTISVVYSGDTNFVTSTSITLVQTVNQASSSSSLALLTNPAVFGQTVTFTTTVSAVAPGAGTPTGTVTFQNGVTALGTATLALVAGSSKATFTTNNLVVGSNSISVVYGGDTNFVGSTSATLTQTINKDSTTTALAASANPAVFGQSVTITVTASAVSPGSGTPTGGVTFLDGSSTVLVTSLSGGAAQYTANNLSTGRHTFTAIYNGDTNFTGSTSATLVQTINQASTATTLNGPLTAIVFGQSVTFTATVSVTTPGAGTPTGFVTFKDGAVSLGTGTLTGGTTASFTASSLGTGTHTITAVYGGDANFGVSTSAAGLQTVNKATTTTTLALAAGSSNPSVFGQSVGFTVTISVTSPGAGMPTGTVTFKDGAASLGTATANGGTATFATTTLGVGSHTITAIYGGDANFSTSTSITLTQTVNKASTTTSLASSINPTVFGQTITFTATVAATSPGSGTATGTVTFLDGGTSFTAVTLSGGKATFAASTLPPGTHTVTAVYAGDVNFAGSTSGSVLQTVAKDGTTTTVTSAANPTVVGQSITLTATVVAQSPGTGTATGTVTFQDGGTSLGTSSLGGGKSSLILASGLSLGLHTITAVYSGDGNFVGSTSATFVQTVNQDHTTTTVTSSLNPLVIGQSVTFTATVAVTSPGAGTPTGTVTFLDGGVSQATSSLAGGTATYTPSSLTKGTHTITAIYGGDTNDIGSTSAALLQSVLQASSTTLTSSTNTSVFGQNVVFTATVNGSTTTPTGTVTFLDGAASLATRVLSGGVATFATTGLSRTGSPHTITAVYGGDSGTISSTSPTILQTVNQDSTATSLTTSANPAGFGQAVTFTATVSASSPGSGTPTGTVTFLDGATSLSTQALSGGTATFSISNLPTGTHTITASYGGDVNFTAGAAATLLQTVVPIGSNTVLLSSRNPSHPGESVTFTATVSGSGASPTGTVTFNDGGASLGTAPLITGTGNTGVATLSITTLAVGNHSITGAYSGDSNFQSSTSIALIQTVNQYGSSTTLTSAPNPSMLNQTVNFTATVTSSGGTPTGSVTFKDGSSTLTVQPLTAGGIATFSTNGLSVGSHFITAVYGGSANFLSSTSAIDTQVVTQFSSTTVLGGAPNPSNFGQVVAFTATVSSGGGTPTGTVTFFDGAASIGTQALASGTATLSTGSLTGGTHSMTAVYGGDVNFAGSTGSFTQTVNPVSTTTTLTSASTTGMEGQSITFTAAIGTSVGTATGTVTFFDGTKSLGLIGVDGTGRAILTTTEIWAGSHTVSAVYAGDVNHVGSTSNTLSITISSALPFSDTFNRPDSPNLGSNYYQAVGAQTITSNQAVPANAGVNLALYNWASVPDVILQADVSLANTSGAHAGLVARYSGPGDGSMYLGALVNVNGSVFGIIYRNFGGSWSELVRAPAASSGHLVFQVQGNSLQLSLNGNLLTSALDNSIQGPGLMGIRSGAASIDNFAADVAQPAVPFNDAFDRADSASLGANYSQPVGSVAIQSHQVTAANSGVNIALYTGASVVDASVQADVTLATTGFAHADLIARYSGPGDTNMYLGSLVSSNGTFLAIIYRHDGTGWSELIRAAAPAASGHLTFIVQGSSLQLFLGNNLLTSTLDSTIQGPGLTGMRIGSATLDNFALAQPSSAQPFLDSFNRADSPNLGSNYFQPMGSVGITSNQAVSTSTGINLALRTGVFTADVAVQADVTLAATGFSHAGLIARYSGGGSGTPAPAADSNMYLGTLVGNNGVYTATIFRNLGGTWTPLSSAAAPSRAGTLRFQVQGNSLVLSLNGTVLISCLDSSIQGPGLVGIRGGAASFDNLTADPAPTGLPFADNFNRADASNLGGSFYQPVGTIAIRSNQAAALGSSASLALYAAGSAADVGVQADVNLAATGSSYAGLVARYSGAGDTNMYVGELDANNGSYSVVIKRNVGGVWSVLATTSVSTGSGTLRFQVIGNSLKLFLNGSLLLGAVDNAIQGAGLSGMRAAGTSVDNFVSEAHT